LSESSSQRLAPERLASSWAKLDRAHGHVDDLRRAIVDACDGQGPPRVLGTSRKFDPDSQRVLFIAERVPEIGDDWGLIIGDAVHNMRCALDHLWWQLAIDYLGRKPTKEEAPAIQFPILTEQAPDDWGKHRFLKYVSSEAAEKAKPFQAYDRTDDQVPIFGALADLSNSDKHREIRPMFFINTNISLPINPISEVMTDCEIPSTIRDGQRVFESEIVYGDERPAVGDVVAGIRVTPTGPSPDIDIEPEITGDIALGEGEYTFGILDEIGRFIFGTLNWFAPLLRDQTLSETSPPRLGMATASFYSERAIAPAVCEHTFDALGRAKSRGAEQAVAARADRGCCSNFRRARGARDSLSRGAG
jgi:hypothetical protein